METAVMAQRVKDAVLKGKTFLGIEPGSTRIKAVLVVTLLI
jgi:activator of 2-hydroxyglutaryl-CoA dehydratase